MDPLTFGAELIEWRGPAPFYFAPLPADVAEQVRRAVKIASYGWGVIPVSAVIGGVEFSTSLFPRDETYLLPVKAAVRKAAGITKGDQVQIDMRVTMPDPMAGL